MERSRRWPEDERGSVSAHAAYEILRVREFRPSRLSESLARTGSHNDSDSDTNDKPMVSNSESHVT